MAKVNLSKEEQQHLEKIENATDYHFTISVKEHFNAVGKLPAFAAAATDADKKAQMDALRGLFSMSPTESTLANLKAKDIFTSVARRVGTDAELAALLPAVSYDQKDVEILEKLQLNSLAALVKARL